MMPAENGFILPCCSQLMLCGTRSLRAMVVPSGPAYQDGEQALVRGHPREIAAQLRLVVLGDELGERRLDRVHDQLRAHLDVRAEPFSQQLLDIGQDRGRRRRTRRARGEARNAIGPNETTRLRMDLNRTCSSQNT